MFILRKLELEEGKDSIIEAGYTSDGDVLTLFDWETNENKRDVNISDVEEGWQVVLTRGLRGYHRTSKIREIVSREDNRIVFKTQTSVYELIEEENDK